LVLVSTDLSGFQVAAPLYFQKEIFVKFVLAEDELVLCGTHTHSAPMVFLNRTYPHPNNWEYVETLRAKLLDVVGRALAGARPAQIGLAVGSSDVGVNRRLRVDGRIEMLPNPAGSMDRDVQVLQIASGGKPIASLFAYAVHSRSLTSKNRLVSGDILGIAEQYVEAALGSPMISAAFAGASGDIDPRHVVGSFDADPALGPSTVDQGNRLGEEVVRVLRAIKPSPGSAIIRTKAERVPAPAKVKDNVKSVGITPPASVMVAFLAMDCEALVTSGKPQGACLPPRSSHQLQRRFTFPPPPLPKALAKSNSLACAQAAAVGSTALSNAQTQIVRRADVACTAGRGFPAANRPACCPYGH
jgi:hypothetical protein